VQFNIISLSLSLSLSIRLSLLRDVPRPTEPEITAAAAAQYLPVRVLHIIIMRQKTVMIIL